MLQGHALGISQVAELPSDIDFLARFARLS
jgi:hypothetical protein